MDLSGFQIAMVMVAGLCLLFALYLELGGHALFGTHEHPEKILGKRARLFQLESGPKGLDPNQPKLPPAKIESYSSEHGYRLTFEIPFQWLEKTEDHAYISARHKGYPVSLAASPWRRGVFVHGSFGSGERFIGAFSLLK
ncbi:MAG: hypothetical protein MPW14_08615 [Candidatus Manganitrophus sp.]|nr:hypothetical protein [Candidatus Manganitrophus sp.]MDC4227880.1 hypothetical protein [Candidatus Manganitrophus sp.]WDT70965.1 MAG: hypothetical protein MPW17_19810 [Candidatus Manganitrophus sp.]WDT81760.1 MAG: hypothetical protein MPW14_08615 [Candidatus Manganitrophus sp.]